MIDLDIYCSNPYVEKFLESLKLKLTKDYHSINVYISTANPYNSWSQKLYNFYNKKEEQNEQIYL
jgi:hypothetical protein